MKPSVHARMRSTRLLGMLCVAFCAAALALPVFAEPAGKVLGADGDALVLRGSQILRLSRGAAVESGDQIHTGSDGKVLIVFTDSGLVWIRANSDFVVDEYSYAQGRHEAAFFSLLKGGARSVTGLIGRRTRSNFRLRVPVATIGIRGTDFSVVMCQRECKDSDGSTAASGLYGEVIQGRIAVTPFEDRLLEREFGAGEFFHLADERSSPTPLFLPPPFLRSAQDEQARFTDRTGIVIAPLPPILGGPVGGTGGGLSGGLPGVGGVTGALNGGLTGLGDLTGTLTGGLTRSVRSVLAESPTRDLTATLAGALQSLPLSSALDSTLGNLTQTLSSLAATLPLVGTSPVPTPVAPIGLPGGTPITTPVLPPIGAPVLPPVGLPGTPITAPIGAPVGTPAAPPIGLPGGTPTTPPIGLPAPGGTPITSPIATPSVPPIVAPAPITTGPAPTLPTLPSLPGLGH